MLDGEIVLFDADGAPDFDALGQRIHPAESRITHARRADPDALHRLRPAGARRRRRCSSCPQAERRDRLEAVVDAPVDLTPATEDPDGGAGVAPGRRGRDRQAPGGAVPPGRARRHEQDQARADDRRGRRRLAARQGAADRRLADPRPLRRRRASCASSATPPASAPSASASWSTSSRPTRPASAGSADPSRWDNERDLEWVALRPELVIEVTFDHTSNDRIRHGAKILRWRDDKDPADCRMDQLQASSIRASAAAPARLRACRPSRLGAPLLQAVELLARGEHLGAVLDAPARERGERVEQLARRPARARSPRARARARRRGAPRGRRARAGAASRSASGATRRRSGAAAR